MALAEFLVFAERRYALGVLTVIEVVFTGVLFGGAGRTLIALGVLCGGAAGLGLAGRKLMATQKKKWL